MSSTNLTSLSINLISIQLKLTRYVYPFYLVFGVIGCCLNVLLFCQRQFRKISCCIYFIAASVMMLLNLSFSVGSTLYALDRQNPTSTILAFCKIRFYFLQSTAMVFRWCLVAACFDRYALSSVNINLRNFAKVHIARRVVLVFVPVCFLLSVYMLIFFNIKAGVCGVVYDAVASLYHSIFALMAGSILPVSLMITFALLIHHNLVLKRRRRQQNVNRPSEGRNKIKDLQRKRDQQVLLMLLVQAFVFVILTTPALTYNIYAAATIYVSNKTPDRLVIDRVAGFLAEMILLLFPVSSFYVYTLSSRTFRDELVRVVISVLTCQWLMNTSRIEPWTNNTQNGKGAGQQPTILMGSQSFIRDQVILRHPIEADQQQANIVQDSAQ